MIQKISQLPGSIAALSCNGKDPDEQVYNIEIDVRSAVDGIVNCLGELLRPAPVKADKSAEDQGYGVVDEGQRKMENEKEFSMENRFKVAREKAEKHSAEVKNLVVERRKGKGIVL